MSTATIICLAGLGGFLVGLVAGCLGTALMPAFWSHTVWFLIKKEHEPKVAEKMGHIPDLEVSPPGEGSDLMLVTIRLRAWFDFENNNGCNYLQDLLKSLEKWNIPVHKSGTY